MDGRQTPLAAIVLITHLFLRSTQSNPLTISRMIMIAFGCATDRVEHIRFRNKRISSPSRCDTRSNVCFRDLPSNHSTCTVICPM